jgi:hypothetical protein
MAARVILVVAAVLTPQLLEARLFLPKSSRVYMDENDGGLVSKCTAGNTAPGCRWYSQKAYGAPGETNAADFYKEDDFGYFSGAHAGCTPEKYYQEKASPGAHPNCACTSTDYIYNQDKVMYNNQSVPGPCSQAERLKLSAQDKPTPAEEQTCFLTERPPKKNQVNLHLCHLHSESSCCIPVQDMEIDDDYSVTLEAGDRCAQELVRPKLDLRDLFCFGCDPKSPQYIINGSIHICASQAVRVLPKYFDECGLMTVEQRGCDFGCDDSVMPSRYWTGGANYDDLGLALGPTDTTTGSGGAAIAALTGTQGGFFGDAGEWQGDDVNLWPANSLANGSPCTPSTPAEDCITIRKPSSFSADDPTQWESVVQFITSPTGAFPSFMWEIFSDPGGDDTSTNIVFVEDYDITCDADKCTIDTSKVIDDTPCFKSPATRPAAGAAALGLALAASLLNLFR